MARVELDSITKIFGDVRAVDDVTLKIEDGEFLVLLGPSGCGKTTTLRCIAGLESVDGGSVVIDGKDVTYLPPRKRGVSMVFQSYAVFPHLKVFDNIAFGLRLKGVQLSERERRVREAAELLGLEDLLDRFPHQLSGGQKQRVAVARAIVVEPEVLLMDEPLSNIDALLRLRMRAELKLLQRRLGATTIYVTHDQVEAMSIGDRIAVMRDGKIIQCDKPTKIYDEPADTFVGGFIGTPPMNFLRGAVTDMEGRLGVEIQGFFLECHDVLSRLMPGRVGEEILVGIRPESVEAHNEPARGAIEARVLLEEALGSSKLLTVQIGDETAKFTVPPGFQVRSDGRIWLSVQKDRIRFMDRGTGKTIIPG
jgi:multiple sugar transport system ATP-binding protein